ncbi:MAG: UDP-N-acetylmuramate dehydrogenase [Tatlockia sp.]|nr:UDP-N-acetylmuramate dehydrogenase [Tatlockia sp.]
MNTSEEEIQINQAAFQGQLLFNEPLANYTTWRVGGLARKMYKPAGIADLALFVKQLPKEEQLLWLGLGSNSLIRDTGFTGTIVLTQGCLKDLSLIDEEMIRVEAGVSCAKMARFCARANLAGGEFWAGIPGTMGGALRMNAGCSGRETWEAVVEVETMTRDGEIRVRKREEFEIAYRHVTGLLEEEWFVAATCRLTPGEKESSLQLIKELLAHRANTQPTNEYNCGSVFRNPPGNFAARLIEGCGLKGKQLGGAVVSEKHANFIINQGIASAYDIETLIELVRDTVYKATNVELIREVHIIGDL